MSKLANWAIITAAAYVVLGKWGVVAVVVVFLMIIAATFGEGVAEARERRNMRDFMRRMRGDRT